MIPARYPLRAALEQRRALVEEARRSLAAAIREAEEQERRRAEAAADRDSLAVRCERLRRRLYEPDERGHLQVAEVARRTDGLRNREESLQAAERRLGQEVEASARAVVLVADARQQLVDADAQLEVVEKHLEGWLASERREAGRRDERLAEEVVQARHAASRADVEALERATEEP